MAERPRVLVMLSGVGSNLDAMLAHARQHGDFAVDHVLSDQPDSAGLARAAGLGIATTCCARAPGATRQAHDAVVMQALQAAAPDLVVLAGYMRILGGALVRAWHGKMLNVHPSLLPKYKGLHTYRRALADNEPWHGASVHFVSEALDGGPVIAQARVAIEAQDTESSLKARTQRVEHELYPATVAAVCRGDIALGPDDRVRWRGTVLSDPLRLHDLAPPPGESDATSAGRA